MAIAKDFVFVGRLCLDLVHTGDMGYGSAFERLTVPSELRRWLSLCPLRLTTDRTTTGDLEQAKKLRGAIWRVANAVLDSGGSCSRRRPPDQRHGLPTRSVQRAG